MNLRKDHCRDPQTKQTVNVLSMPLELLLELGPNLPFGGRGHKRTHGAEGVKEH